MRVIHAASSYPLGPSDSTAPFMEEMLQAFVERGHEAWIVVPRVDGLVEGVRRGVHVVGAPYGPPRLQVWGYGRSLNSNSRIRASAMIMTPPAVLSMAGTLRRLIRSQVPDVIHLHWVLPQGVLGAAIPREVPLVVSVHGADARMARGLLRPLVDKVLFRADATVAASKPILDFVVGVRPASGAKRHVIPHGANQQLFRGASRSNARVKLGIDPSLVVVFAVGRLVRKKGFRHLIEAMRLLGRTNAELFIAGSGPELATLKSTIQSDTKVRTHLIGQQSRDDLAEWFAAADVVAIPSIPDGDDVDSGPVVLIEALAAGRPIVASFVGMAPDLINDGENGFLVDPTDSAALAAALDSAISDTDRLGLGARQTFETLGDWGRAAGQLEAVYLEAIGHRKEVMSS